MNRGYNHIKLDEIAEKVQNMSAYYAIPENYFQELPSIIADKISIAIIKTEEKNSLYQVPQEYFDNLEASILNKINISKTGANTTQLQSKTELLAIAPTLANNKIGMPYTVDDKYFQQSLAVNIVTPKQAKVVALLKNSNFKKLFAAASIITILFATALVWQNKPGKTIANTTINLEDSLSKIPEVALQDYVQNHGLTDTDFSNDMVETLLNANVEEHLQSYTDEELKTFLKENEQLNNFKKRI
ncbi:MAG: hypothetical protein ACOVQE_07685 [Chitinophagaceae bacterium]